MAAGEAHPATERVPADADRRARPGRDRRAVRRQGGVDVDQLRAGADRRGSVRAVDADLVEVAQVEHDAALQRRVPRIAVTSRPRANRHAAARPSSGSPTARRRRRQGVRPHSAGPSQSARCRRARPGRSPVEPAFEHVAADRLLEGSRDRACQRRGAVTSGLRRAGSRARTPPPVRTPRPETSGGRFRRRQPRSTPPRASRIAVAALAGSSSRATTRSSSFCTDGSRSIDASSARRIR